MQRPNGEGQISAGWWLIVLGIGAAIIGIVLDAGDFRGELNVGDLATKLILIYVGAGSVGAGFTLLIAGWIIQAISFLPGRGDAPARIVIDRQDDDAPTAAGTYEGAVDENGDDALSSSEWKSLSMTILVMLAVGAFVALVGYLGQGH